MEFFSQTYVALRGPTGVPQTASDTIGRLADRLSPSTLLADRRAAVLALKGLSRDHRREVGDRALPGLLQVLQNDAEIDADIGKAVLETIHALCEPDETPGPGREDAVRFCDQVLATEKPVESLLGLLAGSNFFAKFSALQLLSTLLQIRRQAVQGYFLKAENGPASVLAVLDDNREMIRNETVSMIQALVVHSPDIQKLLAFEGLFEKLFRIISNEGGVDGGIVVQEALTCVDALLRYNTSNQSYFRETQMPPQLRALLLFPVSLPPQEPAPQQFALQFWDDQKGKNSALIVGIIGLLLAGTAENSQEAYMFTRCLVEVALASNFPVPVKTLALAVLPDKLNFPLSELVLAPYMPVPGSNGEEWDRLEPASALDCLVELSLHGEYNGITGGTRQREHMELRAAATKVFENFVSSDEIKEAIVRSMLPPPDQDQSQAPPITPLLYSLIVAPETPLSDTTSVTSTHFATLLFAHLLRSCSGAKAASRQIRPPTTQPPDGGSLFVPADGPAPAPPQPTPEEDDDDPPQTIIEILNENLSLALLARSRPDKTERESREWDRISAIYIAFLSQWLWNDPASVREFLGAGGLAVLVEPINQASEVDAVVPALCVFLLGVCYEFNREPGEITRATIYPILNRFGVDSLVGHLTRLREDERFRSIGPERIALDYPTPPHANPGLKAENELESEIWFDWPFVDFWKSNYYTIQRGFSVPPDQISPAASQNAETSMLVASLRDVIRKQSQEIETLQAQLQQSTKTDSNKEDELMAQISSLRAELSASAEKHKETEKSLAASEEKRKEVEKELAASVEKCKETEKEQEDLLVLLDELSSKRKRDKERLRKAGQEVSEDEDEEDEEDDED